MNYDKAIQIQKAICDQFFFNRKNVEAFAGDFDNDPEPSELIYDIFGDVFAINVIEPQEKFYVIELLSESNDLYITPIIDFFNLQKGDIINTTSDPIILQTRKRPLEIGCSIGPLNEGWRGTLGCFVKDIDNGDKYVLSNHHVLFSAAGHKDNFIIQPSTYDGGDTKDAIGLYVRSLAPDPSGVNNFDAAVAGPISVETNSIIPESKDSIQGIAKATIGMKVYKIGATTGKTFGVITSVSSALKVKDENGKLLDYQDQFTIQGTQKDFLNPDNFSLPGDSGSVIIDSETNTIVGLLFSGNGKLNSYANKIDPLFTQLRVSF